MDETNPNPFGPIDPARLTAFESRLGERLPSDYRQFLVRTNGGGLTPGEIVLPGTSEPFATLSDHTFGLHESDGDLEAVYDNCCDVLPEPLIAFAEDVGGNLLCIGVRGDTRGQVFFWDHGESSPGDDEPGWDGLTLLAPSFDAFVRHLGREQPGTG